MKAYTIKEISNIFHLPASTLRYYEEVGILQEIERTSSGQRIYTEDHINRLYAICCFKRAGVTIADLQKYFLLEDEKFTHIDEILLLLTKNKEKMEAQIKQLSDGLTHINEKLAYYKAIKKAIEENTEFPCWQGFMN
ncbi:MAG: MerR family transcriptional regulator, partial [Acetatifactor sp.]